MLTCYPADTMALSDNTCFTLLGSPPRPCVSPAAYDPANFSPNGNAPNLSAPPCTTLFVSAQSAPDPMRRSMIALLTGHPARGHLCFAGHISVSRRRPPRRCSIVCWIDLGLWSLLLKSCLHLYSLALGRITGVPSFTPIHCRFGRYLCVLPVVLVPL
jgi:hypothetical protein